MPNNIDGTWGELLDWPLIPIHAILLDNGKILSFGTDENGMQGGQFIYDVYDPVTDTHTTLPNFTPTDIFCSAAIVIPGSSQILVGGGDARTVGNPNGGVKDVNIFDTADNSLVPSDVGQMNYARWYPTMVSLPTGQIVILGGIDENHNGVPVPEIYTPGEGWRTLPGAYDADLIEDDYYPRAWLGGTGEVFYFAVDTQDQSQTNRLVALNPAGDGSMREVATLPFAVAWESPAIMYEPGKVLIMAQNGDLWTMDISGPTPSFAQTGDLAQDRNWSNMTIMPDGTVLITGGTITGTQELGASYNAAIWNPDTDTVYETTALQDDPRLYHSTGILMADGRILSMGGGASIDSENNYLTAQIYTPSYLYDENGDLADRPVISSAPDSLVPGQTFTITVDDASNITKVNFIKTAAVTHSVPMDTKSIELDFTIGPNNTLEITLPDNVNTVDAGNWMLFVIDGEGVPAIAPIISVEPTQALYDAIGDLRAEYFTVSETVTELADIDFTQAPDFAKRMAEIDIEPGDGIPTVGPDDFAIHITGSFIVAASGDYTFYLSNDDSARLIIDGVVLASQEGTAGVTETIVSAVTLDPGVHTIEVQYFDESGDTTLDLDWSGPGRARSQMLFDGAEQNLLVNGGLELASITDYTVVDELPGWTSTTGQFGMHPQYLDFADPGVVSGGVTNVQVHSLVGALSQSVQTEAGKVYKLSFDLHAKPSAPEGSEIEVLWNGASIATILPEGLDWPNWEFEVTGTGGNDTLTFQSTISGQPWDGAYLDSVVLKPVVEDSVPDPFIPVYDTIGDLRAEYFELDSSVQNLAGIDFDQTPDYAIRLAQLELEPANANTQVQADDFAIRYTGSFHVEQSGTHQFYLTNDDSARLIIDGNAIVDQEGIAGQTETTSDSITLDEGLHTIEILYFDDAGDSHLDLDWSGPAFARTQMTFDGAEENLLTNGALDLEGITTYTVVAEMPGWSSSSGLFAAHPRWEQFAETSTLANNGSHLQINENFGSLSQNIQTDDGTVYNLSFDLAGKPGALAESEIEVLWNGAVIATAGADSINWRNWEFSVTGTSAQDTLTFRSTSSGNPWDGAYLDSIVLKRDEAFAQSFAVNSSSQSSQAFAQPPSQSGSIPPEQLIALTNNTESQTAGPVILADPFQLSGFRLPELWSPATDSNSNQLLLTGETSNQNPLILSTLSSGPSLLFTGNAGAGGAGSPLSADDYSWDVY